MMKACILFIHTEGGNGYCSHDDKNNNSLSWLIIFKSLFIYFSWNIIIYENIYADRRYPDFFIGSKCPCFPRPDLNGDRGDGGGPQGAYCIFRVTVE